ncbi:MAG: hypothetical protein SFW36_12940 [Leptolyngbyaceae cyanobacterium bins.59]|nr:hypothetical protein [Leptolyngbyaceae cyanobacterium bins.59]
MGSAYLFVLTLILGSPLYILIRAICLVLPGYVVLLGVGFVGMGLFWWNPRNLFSDSIIGLLPFLLGGVVSLLGFAFAPLWVQLGITAGLLGLQRLYFRDVLN